jgi:transcriptional regulator with XRE-family HTH domain
MRYSRATKTVEESLSLLFGGNLPATAPLVREKGGRKRRSQANKEVGQIYLATIFEGANPLRLSHLWGITGLPGGEEVEEILLGLRPSPFPKGLEGALKAFDHFYPERVVEAGYWGSLATVGALPEKDRIRALTFASRLLDASPLLPKERTALYRLRKAYGQGIKASSSFPRGSTQGVAVAVLYNPSVGEFLRLIRNRLGVTQAELAEKLNVSQERISFIEKAKGHKVRIGTIERYVRGLGGKVILPKPASPEETLKAYFHSLQGKEGEASIKVVDERGERIGEYFWVR